MLEHIDRAAQDHLTEPPTSIREVRDQLRELADVLAQAGKAYYDLGWGAAFALTSTAKDRGIEPLDCDYLKKLADVAKAAAAGMSVVKRGPQDDRLNTFIRTLDAYVFHFAGWRGVHTVKRVYVEAKDEDETLYSGDFFEVVKACIEPLGIKKSDAALAKAIERAKDKLTA